MSQKRRAVGRFSNRIDTEHALGALKRAGFSVAQISMVAKYVDCDAQFDRASLSNCARNEARSEATTGAITGGMLGAVLGCLIGLGILVVPGVSFRLAVRTAGTAVATTLGGAGIGATGGGLILALTSLEMDDPTRVERDYALSSQPPKGDRSLQGEFLVMVDGTDEEVRRAESILTSSCSSKIWIC